MESEEIWRPVVGYEGFYEVSDCGNVRSVDRWVKGKSGSQHLIKSKTLKQTRLKNGYLQVGLCKNEKQSMIYVHRLVAQAFIPNPDNLPVCNHKDENPLNNKSINLEWCTQKYNINYGTRTKRSAKTMSEKNKNNPKLSKEVYQYTLDGQLVKKWESISECGRNGYHPSACCRGLYNHHKGFIWKYE